ncbi:hypothetical protein ACFE04_014966 [Oxalis oulophora]
MLLQEKEEEQQQQQTKNVTEKPTKRKKRTWKRMINKEAWKFKAFGSHLFKFNSRLHFHLSFMEDFIFKAKTSSSRSIEVVLNKIDGGNLSINLDQRFRYLVDLDQGFNGTYLWANIV